MINKAILCSALAVVAAVSNISLDKGEAYQYEKRNLEAGSPIYQTWHNFRSGRNLGGGTAADTGFSNFWRNFRTGRNLGGSL